MHRRLQHLLQTHLRNVRVLEWPSADAPFEVSPPQPGFSAGLSYEWSYNYALNGVRDSRDQHVGAAFSPLSAINSPCATILFVDSWPVRLRDPDVEGAHEIAWQLGSRQAAAHPWDDGNPRHHSGFNLVFVDGHTGWRRRERLAGGRFAGGTRDQEWLRAQWRRDRGPVSAASPSSRQPAAARRARDLPHHPLGQRN